MPTSDSLTKSLRQEYEAQSANPKASGYETTKPIDLLLGPACRDCGAPAVSTWSRPSDESKRKLIRWARCDACEDACRRENEANRKALGL